MSHRIPQIESTLRRALAEVLRTGIADPRIVGMVSITKMSVAPDLKNAYVYVSIMPEKYEKRTLAGLQHATRHIQRLTREKVAMRVVPHFEFRLDSSLKKQAAVEQAIHDGLTRTAPGSPPGSLPASSPTPASEESATKSGIPESNQDPQP